MAGTTEHQHGPVDGSDDARLAHVRAYRVGAGTGISNGAARLAAALFRDPRRRRGRPLQPQEPAYCGASDERHLKCDSRHAGPIASRAALACVCDGFFGRDRAGVSATGTPDADQRHCRRPAPHERPGAQFHGAERGQSAGPAAAGLLIAFIGAHGSYYTQAAMFMLATLWTVQMAIPERSPESAAVRREPFMRSIVAGLAFVVQDRDIRTLMILAHGPLTLGMPYMSLMPIFAKDVLHGGAQLQGFLLTIIGVGSVLGALGVASIGRRYSYGHSVVIGALAFGVTLFGFASARDLLLSSLCAFGVGVCVVVYQTQNQTLLQLLAPREMRGRVMSIFLLNRGMVPLGTFVGRCPRRAPGRSPGVADHEPGGARRGCLGEPADAALPEAARRIPRPRADTVSTCAGCVDRWR